MEVTNSNYETALKEINILLKDADFISFDSEMSGLGRSYGDRNHDLDTTASRYEKASKRVKEYGLIQIGISIFRFCKETKKYLNATYCFFLSGREDGSYRYDASSMMFLAENGFDFNKLFLYGLTFMPISQEKDIRKGREDRLLKEKDSTPPTPVRLKDDKAKSFYAEMMEKISNSKDKKEELIIEGKTLNSFLRKVLFTNIAPMFPNSFFENHGGSQRNIRVVHFESEAEKNRYVDCAWEADLNQKIGFNHVVKAILEANKPLVGHNIILDIMHFVDKFVTPLPPGLEEFKTIVKETLPPFYDTKLLARDPPFSAGIMNTALGCLYDELTTNYSPPTFDVAPGYQGYSVAKDGQAHDGGYDAFMTGVCFVVMLKTLEGKQWEKNNMMKSKHLLNYVSKINFIGSYDIPFININKPDVIPDRSYIYSVTCPSSWTNIEVRHTFRNLKGYKTVWVNDTHLYLIPLDDGDIADAKSGKGLKRIQASCPPILKVTIYGSEAISNGGGRGEAPRIQSGVKQPGSITLKRRSDTKKDPDVGADASEDSNDACSRNLKRLKSVGSEQLSNMSLESPMNPDKSLESSLSSDVKKMDSRVSSEIFSVPDDWS